MFYKHVLLNLNGETVLYLYLTNYYEFSHELGRTSHEKEKNIKKRVQNYIRNVGVPFYGKRIFLVVDGIIVGSLLLNDSSKRGNYWMKFIPSVPSYQEIVNASHPGNVHHKVIESVEGRDMTSFFIPMIASNGTILQINLEDYVLGSIAAAMPIPFHLETFKALAVVCRTYVLKQLESSHRISDVTEFFTYHDESYFKKLWGSLYKVNLNKVRNAVNATKGQYLSYHAHIIDPYFDLRDSNINIPYLQQSSILSQKTPTYFETIEKPIGLVELALGMELSEDMTVQIVKVSDQGEARHIQIADKIYDTKDLQRALQLPTSDFQMKILPHSIQFVSKETIPPTGMSQLGAEGMARMHFTYRDILNHYYKDTILSIVTGNLFHKLLS